MKSREDVINGLECYLNFVQRSDCECCGYKCDKDMFLSVPINLLADALALLKAQEPRVMTLEEVAGYVALERETPIYMEFGYMATHAGQVMDLNPKHMYFDDENGLSWRVREGPDHGKQDGVRLDEYNDIWRCWTSRPDNATREATPWE